MAFKNSLKFILYVVYHLYNDIAVHVVVVLCLQGSHLNWVMIVYIAIVNFDDLVIF
jgi:hypothetical protein